MATNHGDTPIGGKLVFERWTSAGGTPYARVRLVYATAEQLRSATTLVGGNQPMSVGLSFEGLAANEDGLYPYDALRARITEAVEAYDQLVEDYALPEAA